MIKGSHTKARRHKALFAFLRGFVTSCETHNAIPSCAESVGDANDQPTAERIGDRGHEPRLTTDDQSERMIL